MTTTTTTSRRQQRRLVTAIIMTNHQQQPWRFDPNLYWIITITGLHQVRQKQQLQPLSCCLKKRCWQEMRAPTKGRPAEIFAIIITLPTLWPSLYVTSIRNIHLHISQVLTFRREKSIHNCCVGSRELLAFCLARAQGRTGLAISNSCNPQSCGKGLTCIFLLGRYNN